MSQATRYTHGYYFIPQQYLTREGGQYKLYGENDINSCRTNIPELVRLTDREFYCRLGKPRIDDPPSRITKLPEAVIVDFPDCEAKLRLDPELKVIVEIEVSSHLHLDIDALASSFNSIVLLIAIVGDYKFNRNMFRTVQVAYQEEEEIMFPNGDLITVNRPIASCSSIGYYSEKYYIDSSSECLSLIQHNTDFYGKYLRSVTTSRGLELCTLGLGIGDGCYFGHEYWGILNCRPLHECKVSLRLYCKLQELITFTYVALLVRVVNDLSNETDVLEQITQYIGNNASPPIVCYCTEW